MKSKVIIVLHLMILILACSSFIWLDWKLIVVGLLIYWLQILFFKTCILTIAQYGDKNHSFAGKYINGILKPFKKELSLKQQRVFMRKILPLTIFILSIIFQLLMNWEPFFRLKI